MSSRAAIKTPLWRRFPSTTPVAFYDPFSQHIELCEMDSKKLVASFDYRNAPHETIKVYPVLIHEFRHWLDHVTTLWGLRRLAEATDAINAWTNQNEKELWRINAYACNVNRDFLTDYFTTIENREAPEKVADQWIAQYSCGVGFNHDGTPNESDPIFFTRFFWEDRTCVGRVPFSVSALLEINAMHTEISTSSLIANAMNAIDKKIEMGRLEKLFTRSLYSPDLAVYSTAVHAVANKMKLSSGDMAYPLASALSAYCLNFPVSEFGKLSIPEELNHFGARNAAALKRFDRGYLFLALSQFGNRELVGTPVDWVLDAAEKAGLPNFETIQKEVLKEREAISSNVTAGIAKDRFEEIFKIGNEMSEVVGPLPEPTTILSNMHKLVVPPVVCNDAEVHLLHRANEFWSPEMIENWCSNCSSWSRTFSDFLSACQR